MDTNSATKEEVHPKQKISIFLSQRVKFRSKRSEVKTIYECDLLSSFRLCRKPHNRRKSIVNFFGKHISQ